MPAAAKVKEAEKVVVPFGNRILVEVKVITKTEAGIELPPGTEEGMVSSGHVRAIGCGVDADLLYSDLKDVSSRSRGLKVGDKVYLPRGTNVGDKFFGEEGKILLVIPPDYITAIIEEK